VNLRDCGHGIVAGITTLVNVTLRTSSQYSRNRAWEKPTRVTIRTLI